MAPLKQLEQHELKTVHDWLRTLGMPAGRQLHRDYADGYLVARLLKKLYPKLVEMHNYQARYGQDLKMVNWQTLQFKVFNRIGLPLTKDQIAELVKGESNTNAVERLFWSLMNIVQGKVQPSRIVSQASKKSLITEPSRILHKPPVKAKSHHVAVIPRKSTVAVKTEKQQQQLQVQPPQMRMENQKQLPSQPQQQIEQDQKEMEQLQLSSEPLSLIETNNFSSTTFTVVKDESTERIKDVTSRNTVELSYENMMDKLQVKEGTIKALKEKVDMLENLVKEKDDEIKNLKKMVT